VAETTRNRAEKRARVGFNKYEISLSLSLSLSLSRSLFLSLSRRNFNTPRSRLASIAFFLRMIEREYNRFPRRFALKESWRFSSNLRIIIFPLIVPLRHVPLTLFARLSLSLARARVFN